MNTEYSAFIIATRNVVQRFSLARIFRKLYPIAWDEIDPVTPNSGAKPICWVDYDFFKREQTIDDYIAAVTKQISKCDKVVLITVSESLAYAFDITFPLAYAREIGMPIETIFTSELC